jgi:uncharacterized protein
MELTGSKQIQQTPERVWAALNDEQILMQCITGCESMERIDAHSLAAKLAIKLGPVRAKFDGRVVMSDIKPQEGYTLNFEGSGGAAGFAKGSSKVKLTPVGSFTEVSYTAQASVGGKLGQIGGRMIDAAARNMADNFFATFAQKLEAAPADNQTISESTNQSTRQSIAPSSTPAPTPLPQLISVASPPKTDDKLFWFCAGIACGVVLMLIGKHLL